MSFSSMLEEINMNFDNDQNKSLLTWNKPLIHHPNIVDPLIKAEMKDTPASSYLNSNLTTIKQEPLQHFGSPINSAHMLMSYNVTSEPNPYFSNSNSNNSNDAFCQQHPPPSYFYQRTHVPIQYDEHYNTNSLPRQQFMMNSNQYATPNLKLEKNRKRPNKKSEPRKKVIKICIS